MSDDWSESQARLPPHSIEAEQGVLGCILVDPVSACERLSECILKFKSPDVFYDLPHREIYRAMLYLFDDNDPVTILSVRQHLADMLLLAKVGGAGYLTELPDKVPSGEHIHYCIEVLLEKYAARQIIATCTELTARAWDGQAPSLELIAQADKAVQAAAALLTSTSSTKKASELVQPAISSIEAIHASGGALIGIPTGLADLDAITRGLQPGRVYVVAARPAAGKSALGMNIAEHASIHSGIPSCVFSLEMSAESLVMRAMCSQGKVNMTRVQQGQCSEADYAHMTAAFAKINGAPLYIDDEPACTISQLRAKARQIVRTFGVRLFVIDYLQLLTAPGFKSRQEEVATISRGVKLISRELSVPVVLLAQLNREIEKGNNRRPRQSDLRESGAVEQDADLIGMLWSPKGDPGEEDTSTTQYAKMVNLCIVKHRHGPTGDIPLVFIKPMTRFESAAK